MSQERLFRRDITEAYRSGKIGIENGWLVEYTDGDEVVPLKDLWVDWFDGDE